MKKRYSFSLVEMAHRLILLLFLFIVATSNGQVQKDKLMHFGSVSMITSATYLIVKDKKKAFIYSVISTATIGLVKELYDENKYKGFDSKDLGATVLGGLVVNATIEFTNKKRKIIIFK